MYGVTRPRVTDRKVVCTVLMPVGSDGRDDALGADDLPTDDSKEIPNGSIDNPDDSKETSAA